MRKVPHGMSQALLFLWALHVVCLIAHAQDFIADVTFRKPPGSGKSQSQILSARLREEIFVDGKLDEHVWKAAAPVSGFIEYQVSEPEPLPSGQTTLFFAHTQDTLYIAATCDAQEPGRIKHDAPPSNRDKGAYDDDCLDIIFITKGGDKYQLIVGAGGARMDLKNAAPEWNPEWSAATAVGENAWTAEIAIPLGAIGYENIQAGDAVRFNIGRASATGKPEPPLVEIGRPERRISSLFPGYSNPEKMGFLILGTPEERQSLLAEDPGRTVESLRFFLDKCVYDEFDGPARGRLRLLGAGSSGSNGLDDLTIDMTLRPEGGGVAVKTASIGNIAGEVVDFTLDSPSLTPGRYEVVADLKDGNGNTLQSATCPLVRNIAEPVPAEGAIALNVNIPEAALRHVSAGNPIPVYAGVPFPKGAATKKSAFSLMDSKGRDLPCQTEVMSTWSPDGYVRWLGVRFIADTAETRYSLRYGTAAPAVKRPDCPVRVETTDNGYVVDTGTLRFEVLRSGFDGLHRAWFDRNGDGTIAPEEQVLDQTKPGGPYVADQAGKKYHSRLDPRSDVTLESADAICAVIRASGWYMAEDGSHVCRYVVRIVAHSGLSWVKVFHTFIFCADSRDVKLSDIGWSIAMRQPSNRFRFGTDSGEMSLAAGGNQAASLLQYESDRYDLRSFSKEEGAQTDPLVFSCGQRAPGWMETHDGTVAIAAGLKDCAATYPKELEADSRGMTVHIWPGNGLDFRTKPLTDRNLSELWFVHHRRLLDFAVPDWFSGFELPTPPKDPATTYRYVRGSATENGMGVARSNELFLNFRPLSRDNTGAVADFVGSPPLAAAEPAWMCRSGVFGPVEPVDKETFPLVEKSLDLRHDGERAIEKFSIGMFNHGGSVSYFNPREQSYSQLDRPWRLTHHGGPRAPWLLFARSGERKFADYAVRTGYWCADIGFCHYSTPAMERLGYDGKIRGGQCDYKGIVPWSAGARVMDYNSMADFLQYMTYFTGDRWPLEVAQEWGECTKERFSLNIARSAAGTLDTLLSLYEGTWDMEYRELAEQQFQYLADNVFTADGYFKVGHWYDYAPWLAHFHRLTGSDKAADMAVRWSDRVIRDHWLGDGISGTDPDTSFLPQMGYPMYDVLRIAHEKTGDRKYLDFGLGCAILPALSTVDQPGSYMHSMDFYSAGSTGGYYTQTVPYILPVLKAQQDDVQPLFPRWSARAQSFRLFIRDEGKDELAVRIHVDGGSAGAAVPSPFNYSIVMPDGSATEPRPAEVATVIPCEESNAGSNKFSLTYAQIVLSSDMLTTGPLQVILTPASDKKDVVVFAPIQTSRPARIVFSWEKGINFSRGSAIYFAAPEPGDVAVKAYSRYVTGSHMLALLDAKSRIRALRQWYPPETDPEVIVNAQAGERDAGEIWCCLQGLTKHMFIEPASGNIHPFFTDRPERFFLPDAARQRSAPQGDVPLGAN